MPHIIIRCNSSCHHFSGKARNDSISSKPCLESGGNDLDDKKKVPMPYDAIKAVAVQANEQVQQPMRKIYSVSLILFYTINRMVEAIANGIEDRLVERLSFKLAPGSSYVTQHQSVTFHPQGSHVYKTSSGTKFNRLL